MIRVLNVCSDGNIGEAGKCIASFCERFDRERFDVSVALPKDSLLVPELERLTEGPFPRVRVHLLNIEPDKSYDRPAVKKLKKLIKRVKPDIVHTHASMSARIAARRCGVLVVYTRHSVLEQPGSRTRGIGKWLGGFVNNRSADRVIAMAEAARQNLIDEGVSHKKISVVLNGVAPLEAVDTTEVRRKYGVSDDEKVVAIAARLSEDKGHKYFIDAAEIVLKRGIKIKFLIVGGGECEEDVRSYISEKGLTENVLMTGDVEDAAGIMSLLDIQVNCSFGEAATSLPLLEGMSLGKPAVVTDIGGNSGVIKNGENGFVVPVKNAMATANAIIRLLEEKELYERMAGSAAAVFESIFTAEAMTSNIEKIYEEVMEEKKNEKV